MRELRMTLPLGLAAALVGLCGYGKIRYPNYYVSNVPAPRSAKLQPQPLPRSVEVREFSALGFLKEEPIVYRASPEPVDFYNYAQRDEILVAQLRKLWPARSRLVEFSTLWTSLTAGRLEYTS